MPVSNRTLYLGLGPEEKPRDKKRWTHRTAPMLSPLSRVRQRDKARAQIGIPSRVRG